MTATRIVFNETADALKEVHEAFNEDGKAVHEAIDRATREIANVFKRDNPRFDRERFMSAAGYGTGVREDSTERCTVCGMAVYPDSSYASGYRHSRAALHGAVPSRA